MSRITLAYAVIAGITAAACSLGMADLSSGTDGTEPSRTGEPGQGSGTDAGATTDDPRSDEGKKLPEPAPATVDAGVDASVVCKRTTLTPQTSVSLGGGEQWKSPELARIDDELRTETRVFVNQESQELVVSGFGANLPANATIKGLLLEVDRGGGLCVLGKKLALRAPSGERPIASIIDKPWDGVSTFGGFTDDWNGLTVADVNAPSFAVVMKVGFSKANSCNDPRFGRVDAVRIQVEHCEGGI